MADLESRVRELEQSGTGVGCLSVIIFALLVAGVVGWTVHEMRIEQVEKHIAKETIIP